MSEPAATTALPVQPPDLADFLEGSDDCFMALDPLGRITYVNSTAEAFVGLAREQLLGRNVFDVFPEARTTQFFEQFQTVVRDNVAVRYEEYYEPFDKWVEVHAYPIEGGIASVFRDVTERRRRIESVQKREAALRVLVEEMPAVLWSTDTELRVTFCRGAGLETLGARPEKLLGRRVDEIADEAALVAHRRALGGEHVHFRSEVAGRWFEVYLQPRHDENGGVTGVVGAALDLTDQIEAESALRASEERYRLIVETAEEGIWLLDSDGRTTFVNRKLARMLGWSPEQMLGRSLFEFTDESGNAVASGQHEVSFRRRDGSALHALVASNPLLDEDGRHLGSVVMATDITDRRQAERAVRRQERRFRAVFDGAAIGMMLSGEDRRYLDANPAACDLLDRSRDELLSLRIDDVFEGMNDDTWAEFLAAGRREVELPVLRPDGSIVQIQLSARASVLPGVHLSMFRDVTERKALEEQLRQSQKLETIGRLAGGIAHDFNNLLTAIGGYGELVAARLTEGDPVRRDIDEIRRGADRAATLVRQLLAFSRQQVLRPRVLDLNEVVGGVEKLLRRLIGEDVELDTRPASDLGRSRADAGQLEQVIVNLAVNARDAMPGGGRLTIETANVDLDEPAARRSGVEPGRYVQLSVTDTGSGMDAETRERVFEPFFTTKEPGKGTGLGLSVVYGIVQQSGGAIWVETEPGRGSSFKVCLPLVDAPAEAPAPAPVEASPRGGSERVLVVEDEEVVRSLVREILEREGYEVVAASCGAEALELAVEEELPDLLLTDVVMPGMSGTDVFDALRERAPELRVLFMSGYSDEAVVRRVVREGTAIFLQKPFAAADLLGKVRAALDA